MKILREGYNYNNNVVDRALENFGEFIDNKMRYKLFDVRDGSTKDNSVIVSWLTQEEYDDEMLNEFKEQFEEEILPLIKENSTNIDRVILEVAYRGYSDDKDKFEYNVREEVRGESLKESFITEEVSDDIRIAVRRSR